MAKKWNIELIQEYLDENHKGYKVKGEYKNSKSKLTFICPNGHESTKDFSDFREKKNKCNQCRLDNMEKDHFNKFNNNLEQDGYKLIEFVKHKRALIQCPCGHEPYEVSTSNFIMGRRCPCCRNDKLSEERRHSYKFVKEYIESFGYTLHSDKYINNETHLEVSCNHNHPSYPVTYNNFLAGYRCPYCANTIKKTYEDIKERVEEHGYKLLSTEDEYENTDSPLKVMCKEGHVTTKYTHTLKSNCWECAIIGRSGENSPTWKGGISTITDFLRNQINEWKFESLKYYEFLCDIEKTNINLEVHHLIPFSHLVNKMFEITDIKIREVINQYTDEELDIMKNVLLKLHMQKLGVPLNKEVHFLFHKTFGYHNTNESQYLFFKDNYEKFKNGEFNKNNYEIYIHNLTKEDIHNV